MHFTNPLNWLWLPPLGGAVVLLWLRRPRPQDLVVPSLRLWQGLTTPADAQPSRRFLHKRWLLFLQLCAMFLLSLALARPFLLAQEQAGQQYVVVIDNSASMRATDVRPSRLDAARDAAAHFLSTRLRPQDTALVVQTSPRAALVCRMTHDPARLRAALAQIAPTDAPGDLPAALGLAQSAAPSHANAHVQVYSDGVASALSSARSLPSARVETRQISVGTAHPDNIGIAALDALPNPGGGQTLTVTLRQAGHAPHPGLTLSLLDNNALQDARQPAFSQGMAQATFDVPPAQTPHVLTVRLDHCADDLASDNSAFLVLQPARATRVLLVSPGNIFLERGLAALPHVQVTEAAPAPFAALRAQAARADIVVLDGAWALGPVPPGRYLTFGRAGLPTPFVFAPQPPADIALAGHSAHPVMQFVNMRTVRVRSAAQVQAAPWADALASSRRGPLLAAGEGEGSRVVSVAFGLADTDWTLQAAFPLFLANSIAWLGAGSAPGALQPGYAAGQIAQVALPPGAQSAQVMEPDGTTLTTSAPLTGGIVSLPNTSQVGVYSVTGQGGTRFPVAVSLLSPTASALAVRHPPMLSQAAANPASPALRRVPREWWTWAAAAALLLLALEWWVYHRRA